MYYGKSAERTIVESIFARSAFILIGAYIANKKKNHIKSTQPTNFTLYMKNISWCEQCFYFSNNQTHIQWQALYVREKIKHKKRRNVSCVLH